MLHLFPLQVFKEHPLQSRDEYCNCPNIDKASCSAIVNVSSSDTTSPMLISSRFMQIGEDKSVYKSEPNTALLSLILMFGTFTIAYFLKMFRNGKYMGRTVKYLQIIIIKLHGLIL